MLQEGRRALRPRRKTRCAHAHARLLRSFSSLLPYGATSSGLNPLSGERMRCVVISGRYFIISRTGRGGGRRSGSRGPAGGQAGCAGGRGRPLPLSPSSSPTHTHRLYVTYAQDHVNTNKAPLSTCLSPCRCVWSPAPAWSLVETQQTTSLATSKQHAHQPPPRPPPLRGGPPPRGRATAGSPGARACVPACECGDLCAVNRARTSSSHRPAHSAIPRTYFLLNNKAVNRSGHPPGSFYS